LGHDSGSRGLRTVALRHDGSSRSLGLLRLPDLGLRLTQFSLKRLGIHLSDDLTGLDHITVVDQDRCDAPRCLGRNIDLRGFDTPVADRKVVRQPSRLELAPDKDTAPCEESHNHTRCEPLLPPARAHP
jgi:hypothetical protein